MTADGHVGIMSDGAAVLGGERGPGDSVAFGLWEPAELRPPYYNGFEGPNNTTAPALFAYAAIHDRDFVGNPKISRDLQVLKDKIAKRLLDLNAGSTENPVSPAAIKQAAEKQLDSIQKLASALGGPDIHSHAMQIRFLQAIYIMTHQYPSFFRGYPAGRESDPLPGGEPRKSPFQHFTFSPLEFLTNNNFDRVGELKHGIFGRIRTHTPNTTGKQGLWISPLPWMENALEWDRRKAEFKHAVHNAGAFIGNTFRAITSFRPQPARTGGTLTQRSPKLRFQKSTLKRASRPGAVQTLRKGALQSIAGHMARNKFKYAAAVAVIGAVVVGAQHVDTISHAFNTVAHNASQLFASLGHHADSANNAGDTAQAAADAAKAAAKLAQAGAQNADTGAHAVSTLGDHADKAEPAVKALAKTVKGLGTHGDHIKRVADTTRAATSGFTSIASPDALANSELSNNAPLRDAVIKIAGEAHKAGEHLSLAEEIARAKATFVLPIPGVQ